MCLIIISELVLVLNSVFVFVYMSSPYLPLDNAVCKLLAPKPEEPAQKPNVQLLLDLAMLPLVSPWIDAGSLHGTASTP